MRRGFFEKEILDFFIYFSYQSEIIWRAGIFRLENLGSPAGKRPGVFCWRYVAQSTLGIETMNMINIDAKSKLLDDCIKMLLILLAKGGYPHEILVFLLTKGFYVDDFAERDPEKGEFKIQPKFIVENLADTYLWELTILVLDRFQQNTRVFPPELLGACFMKFCARLEKKVSDIARATGSAPKRWKAFAHRPVAKTCLRDYFGTNPPANIADWSHRVQKRMREIMVEDGWIDRSTDDIFAWLESTE